MSALSSRLDNTRWLRTPRQGVPPPPPPLDQVCAHLHPCSAVQSHTHAQPPRSSQQAKGRSKSILKSLNKPDPKLSPWNTLTDPATGKLYYHNTDTNATQWTPPPDLYGGADDNDKGSPEGSRAHAHAGDSEGVPSGGGVAGAGAGAACGGDGEGGEEEVEVSGEAKLWALLVSAEGLGRP